MSQTLPAAGDAEIEWDWQHLHPLSPLLRGGFVLLAIGGWVLSQGLDSILRGLGLPAVGGDYAGDPGGDQVLAHPVLLGLVAVGGVALIAGGSWLSWRFARFRVAAGQVELRTGILFRQHRQVPLERVQAVEISRPLLARVFGVAQVVVQSAGGRGSHLTLAYLGLARAHQVRDHLLDLAARSDEGARARLPRPPQPPPGQVWATPLGGVDDRSPDEVAVLQVPNGRLFVATILHTSTLVLLVALVVAGGAAAAGAVGAITGLVPVLFGVGSSRVRELLLHGNFTLSEVGDSLRLRHGLTDLRTTTIPLHRVQAVEVVQHVWWRPFGWWRVRVNVAGVHREPGRGGGDETAVLPVGRFDDVLLVLATMDARLAGPEIAVAATGEGGEPGWTRVPRRARVLDPVTWRRTGYAVAPAGLLLRRGRLTRSAVVVPHARIQSLGMHQGVLQRRLGLASVRLVSTPGPVSPRVEHLAVEEAERLLREEAARARVARRPQPVRPPGLRTPLADPGADPVD